MVTKNIAKTFTKVGLILFLTSALLLFFGQKKFQDNVYGEYMPRVVGQFIGNVFEYPPFSIVRSWFEVDPSNIKVNTQEKMTSYKLELLRKSLNNYFKSLLQETDKLVSHYDVFHLIKNNYHQFDRLKVRNRFRRYIKDNLDILEISLYKSDGEKLSSVKYKKVPEYLISEKIIQRLDKQDNIFIKNSANENLILISAIKNENKIIGVVSQTINPIFFTKILDFLNINDELFYIKGEDDNYIVDNYAAYQFIQNKSLSFPFMIYEKLSRSKESSLNLNIDEVNFSIGVIIRENNTAGNIVAFLCFLLLLYLGFTIVNFGWKQIQSLKQPKTLYGGVDNLDTTIDTTNSSSHLHNKNKSKESKTPIDTFDKAIEKEVASAKKARPNLSFLEEAQHSLSEQKAKKVAEVAIGKEAGQERQERQEEKKDNKIIFKNKSLSNEDDELYNESFISSR